MGWLSSGGASSAPSGAAGGDLQGTYPNPQLDIGTTTGDILAFQNGGWGRVGVGSDGLALVADHTQVSGLNYLGLANLSGQVGAAQIAASAVGSSQLAANAVTTAKLAAGIPQSLSGGGSATVAVADPSTHTATGDGLIWNGSAWVDQEMEMQVRGFLAWTGLPWGNNTVVATSQSEVACKILLPYNVSITGCVVVVSTAGSTLTAGQNLVTLYNQAGTKQGSTPDQSGIWTAGGAYSASFSGGPFNLSGGPGNYCWVSILSNGTTPASFRCVTSNALFSNVGGGGSAPLLTGASLFAGRIGTAITAPATFTPGNLVNTNAYLAWIGLY